MGTGTEQRSRQEVKTHLARSPLMAAFKEMLPSSPRRGLPDLAQALSARSIFTPFPTIPVFSMATSILSQTWAPLARVALLPLLPAASRLRSMTTQLLINENLAKPISKTISVLKLPPLLA